VLVLDLFSESDNESECSKAEMCLVGDSDSDEEDEVSFLELKKKVKKLSKNDLIKYFEESLEHCHEQSLELKELKEQIMDIAEENQLLRAKAKKLKSKVVANPATTSDMTNVENSALESKVVANDAIISDMKLNIKHLQAKVTANEAITLELKKVNELLKSEAKEREVVIIDHKKEISFLSQQLKDMEAIMIKTKRTP